MPAGFGSSTTTSTSQPHQQSSWGTVNPPSMRQQSSIGATPAPTVAAPPPVGPVAASSGATAQQQAAALAQLMAPLATVSTPIIPPAVSPPATMSMQRNPQLAAVEDKYNTYYNQLGQNADIYNRNSLAAQRDLTTGMENEATSDAARRGFSADTGVSQGLRSKAEYAGMKSAGALGATNAANARQLQNSVLGGMAGVAGADASNMLQQGGFMLDQAKLQQDTANFNAQLAAMQNQNQFNNVMDTLRFFSGGL